jgi:hypothetical protein
VGSCSTLIKDGVPYLHQYVALRQEVIFGPHPLPPQLQALLDTRSEADHLGQSKIYVVTLCRRHCLVQIYEQSHCAVRTDQELGVYAVVGCRLQDWKHSKGERTTDDHDGDRWLAICPQAVAVHMAYQGFVFAEASNPVSLAALKGLDLEGLSVRCPIAGQPKESVPIRSGEQVRVPPRDLPAGRTKRHHSTTVPP